MSYIVTKIRNASINALLFRRIHCDGKKEWTTTNIKLSKLIWKVGCENGKWTQNKRWTFYDGGRTKKIKILIKCLPFSIVFWWITLQSIVQQSGKYCGNSSEKSLRKKELVVWRKTGQNYMFYLDPIICNTCLLHIYIWV